MRMQSHQAILAALCLLICSMPYAESRLTPVTDRILSLVERMTIDTKVSYTESQVESLTVADSILIQNCDKYPYHQQKRNLDGYLSFISDLKVGLRQGLQCLVGESPIGKLHPYHENQAHALLKLLEGPSQKTFRCVEDKTHAFAIARLPPAKEASSRQFDALAADLPFPAVVIDTYRISGFLTRSHEPVVYRDFFKMDERQIDNHLNGQLQQVKGLHRYRNRASLLFHEMTHWLGFTHDNTYPDPVHLYETCCFGGSDFISDAADNLAFRDRACAILKDAELWETNKYRQMRLWKYKHYDQLKTDMQQAYSN